MAAPAASPFADWAVVIVAGDWHAHSGAPSEAFDNARRDLTQAFIAKGFSPADIDQFSARPATATGGRESGSSGERHSRKAAAAPTLSLTPPPLKSDPDLIMTDLRRLTQKAPDGCLVYFTSHGNPSGVLVGDHILSPDAMGYLIDNTCGDRPTVVIVSACFSGVFVPALDGPNRMVLTAARPDRSSFGCGEADRYTYFDGCVLQSLSRVHDFAALAASARACVARREAETGVSPPSEPQLDIGAALRPILPLYAFAAALSPAAAAP